MHKVVPTPELTATVQEHLYWVCNQTLAFADEYSDVRFDARELADEIALAVNLTRFEARQRHQAFVHRASYLLAGDMVISAAAYVPLVASTSDYSESTLEIPYCGGTRFRLEGRDWYDQAGQQALYLPGQASEVETGHFNGLLFNLNPGRLAENISMVSRRAVPRELAERWVQRPVPIDMHDPRVKHLQKMLEVGLGSLVQVNSGGIGDPNGATALGVEQLVYRCSARMVLIGMGCDRQVLI
jgi:hypothetical protein